MTLKSKRWKRAKPHQANYCDAFSAMRPWLVLSADANSPAQLADFHIRLAIVPIWLKTENWERAASLHK